MFGDLKGKKIISCHIGSGSSICAIKDGKYYITIVLNDETVSGDDVVAPTFTEKMSPVETVAHFTSKAQSKYWYNSGIDYTMTYNDCTLNMVVNVKNLQVESIDLKMNYDFSITGSIMGIAIKNGKNPATATRTDVVKYSNDVKFSSLAGYYAEKVDVAWENIYCITQGNNTLTTGYRSPEEALFENKMRKELYQKIFNFWFYNVSFKDGCLLCNIKGPLRKMNYLFKRIKNKIVNGKGKHLY